jgi:hypothetical protein
MQQPHLREIFGELPERRSGILRGNADEGFAAIGYSEPLNSLNSF